MTAAPPTLHHMAGAVAILAYDPEDLQQRVHRVLEDALRRAVTESISRSFLGARPDARLRHAKNLKLLALAHEIQRVACAKTLDDL